MIDIQKLRTSLEGNNFISSILHLPEVDSTNTYAKQNNVPADTLVVTDFQTNGKGRQERKWLSEKNSNLTFSVKKNLPLSPAENHYAVYYFTYQIFSAIKEILSVNAVKCDIDKLEIKWPNDILFEGHKLCGILTESLLPSGIYIIGIGINCNQVKFSPDIKAISLKKITGNEINLNDLLVNIINRFSDNFSEILSKDFSGIFSKWKDSTKMIKKTCSFIDQGDVLNHGNIIDLNEDGSISILYNDKLSKFHSGDIRITGFS